MTGPKSKRRASTIMNRILWLLVILATLGSVHAQEKLPRADALKYAFLLSANLKEMLATPIPTDPDVKRPAAVKDEGCGALALPECKLGPQAFSALGKEVTPVGQLWMAHLVPLRDGQAVADSKLRLVHVGSGDGQVDVPCFALGAHQGADGKPELLVYGKAAEPLLRLPLQPVTAAQGLPVDLRGERKDDSSGALILTFVGKYEARLDVRLAEQ